MDVNFKRIIKWPLTLCTIFFISITGNNANGHALEQSYIFLSFSEHAIQGRVEITISDLNRAFSLDLKTDKSVTSEIISPHIAKIKEYYSRKVKIDLGQGLKLENHSLVTYDLAQYLVIDFEFKDLSEIPEFIDFEYQVLFDVNPIHRGFLVIENDWRSGTFDQESNIALVFSPSESNRRLDLSKSTVMQGYIEMAKLGTHHIWDGIDHVLFLLALLLPSVMYRPQKKWLATEKFSSAFFYVLKIVTVFTVAHTITLSAATLDIVALPSRLVESIIAISIAIAALDILYPIFRQRIWIIVFSFGLFHGFGFASVLGSYNIPDSYMTLSLLAFNLGVEIGQVAIVAVAFPLFYLIRKNWFYHQVVLKFGAIGLIVVSLYWFIERGFLIDLPAGAIVNWFLGHMST